MSRAASASGAASIAPNMALRSAPLLDPPEPVGLGAPLEPEPEWEPVAEGEADEDVVVFVPFRRSALRCARAKPSAFNISEFNMGHDDVR